MFGTDTPPNDREAYRIYYRFLETDDEYFDCAKSHHLQGFWMIYGVFLRRTFWRRSIIRTPIGFCTSATTPRRIRRPPASRRSRPAHPATSRSLVTALRYRSSKQQCHLDV